MNKMVRIQQVDADDARFSTRDYIAMMNVGAFDDMRVELVGGRFQKLSPAQTRHSVMNASIAFLLRSAFGSSSRAMGIDLAIEIDASTLLGVDIAVAQDVFSDGVPPASEVFLAVEIAVTTLSRDLGSKAVDYARCGIPHYWVVDGDASIVHVMSEPTLDGYDIRQVVRFGEPLAVPSTNETITL